MASIAGKEVLDSDFNKDRIRIAFNPFPEDETKRFAVQDASHLKDKRWIPDIAEIFKSDFKQMRFFSDYVKDNPSPIWMTLRKSLQTSNCIPKAIVNMAVKDYDKYLIERRKLMAKLIEKYYKGL